MTTTNVWLYAIVPEERPLGCDVSGVAGESLYAVPGSGMAAVSGRVPRADFDEEPLHLHCQDAAWVDRTGRAHHQAVSELAGQGPVLPLRFATVYRDDSGVAAMLHAHRGRLLAALARLEGRTERLSP